MLETKVQTLFFRQSPKPADLQVLACTASCKGLVSSITPLCVFSDHEHSAIIGQMDFVLVSDLNQRDFASGRHCIHRPPRLANQGQVQRRAPANGLSAPTSVAIQTIACRLYQISPGRSLA